GKVGGYTSGALRGTRLETCRDRSMKAPVTWRGRSLGLGTGGYRGGSAKRSRCYSRISSAFSSSTVYVYEARPARATSSSSQQPLRTFGRWPSWSRCPGPHRNRQSQCSRHYNDLLQAFFNEIGQKRRFDWPSATSAPTRGADVGTDRWRVSTGPEAVSCTQQPAPLFDHLIGADEKRGWDRDSERLGSLEVDN